MKGLEMRWLVTGIIVLAIAGLLYMFMADDSNTPTEGRLRDSGTSEQPVQER